MSTKGDKLSSKQSLSGAIHSEKNHQFSNFNLNHGHKCSNNALSFVQSNSKTNNCKNFATLKLSDHNMTDKKQEKGKAWCKSAKKLNWKNEDEEETKKSWMNDKNGRSDKTSSTLSLHIAAYEDFVERASDENDKLTTSKASKFVVPPLKDEVYQDNFEFPRQMEDDDSNVPEVQQFQASQNLLTPNNSDTTPATTEPNTNDSDGSPLGETIGSTIGGVGGGIGGAFGGSIAGGVPVVGAIVGSGVGAVSGAEGGHYLGGKYGTSAKKANWGKAGEVVAGAYGGTVAAVGGAAAGTAAVGAGAVVAKAVTAGAVQAAGAGAAQAAGAKALEILIEGSKMCS